MAQDVVVATLGSFDGVHRGHISLLQELQMLAKAQGGKSMAITFDPHPLQILAPDTPLRLLLPYSERRRRLETSGVDSVVTLPFNTALAELNAQTFMRSILQEQLGVTTLLMGYDHHFGHDKPKDISSYHQIGSEIGLKIESSRALLEAGIPISSTRIRSHIEQGNISDANRLLGYTYYLTGIVEQGLKIGRTIGYPTANIHPLHPEQILPSNGVYAVRALLEGIRYSGMLYVGNRPTLGGGLKRTIEVHLFDLSRDIYGAEVTIEFVDHVRGEMHFESLESLKTQLALDEQSIRQLLVENQDPKYSSITTNTSTL